jgi:acyl-CoA hydrolase
VEINDQAPWTYCDERLEDLPVKAVIRTSRPVLEVPTGPVGATEATIADHVAALIPNRAVLQMGIGSLPGAILARLQHHQDLGIHSGLVGDGLVDLVECGALTNRFKNVDAGVSITGMLAGTKRLYAHAHLNAQLRLRPVTYTHDHRVLSGIERLHAINSALEVDLTGQVNAEMLGSRYVGAIGGQVDFIRGASRSLGGRAITVLPSTASQGRISRIVASLPAGVVTTARSDADVFVTEWGVADLRGRSLAERAHRMIAIAHPDFRDSLTQAARPLLTLH